MSIHSSTHEHTYLHKHTICAHDQALTIDGRETTDGTGSSYRASSEKQDISIVPTVFYTHIFLFICALTQLSGADHIIRKIECSAHIEKRKSVCHAKAKMKEETKRQQQQQQKNRKYNERKRTNGKQQHKNSHRRRAGALFWLLPLVNSEHRRTRASLVRMLNILCVCVCKIAAATVRGLCVEMHGAHHRHRNHERKKKRDEEKKNVD